MSKTIDISDPPLTGARVLEYSHSGAARVAGGLLAALGADVVRVADVVDDDPEGRVRDRGKRIVSAGADYVRQHATDADVLIVDLPPAKLEEAGLTASDLRPEQSGFCHVWMPPFAQHGEWAELDDDPLLLAAATGISCAYATERSGAIVSPLNDWLPQTHGALAAAAAAAGIVGLERTGVGSAATVSGLHACGAALTTVAADTLDQLMVRPVRNLKIPYWRFFRTSDNEWVFLTAPTLPAFVTTLDLLGRADLIAHPGIAGEFSNLLAAGPGQEAVNTALEEIFVEQTLNHWIGVFQHSKIPITPVRSREEWAKSDIVEANQGLVDVDDPILGTARVAGAPFAFDGLELVDGALPMDAVDATVPPWEHPRILSEWNSEGVPQLPLAGFSVIDAASYIAAPFAAGLLAEYGAEVVRLEPITGDNMRNFIAGFIALNKQKKAIAVNLSDDEGADVLKRLVGASDVLVENLRPSRMARIGLGPEVLAEVNPGLIHLSVTAYGAAEKYANAAGMDAVFQSLGGLAKAQGGDDYPFDSGSPIVDVTTAVLGALASISGLRRKALTGEGIVAHTALARTVTFLQASELSQWAGRPDAPLGYADYPGPSATHRVYECSDGWVAVHSSGAKGIARLADSVGAQDAPGLESAFLTRSVADALARLTASGIPAVRAVTTATTLTDPFFGDNEWFAELPDSDNGPLLVVKAFSEWSAGGGRARASFRPGENTRTVLLEHGYSDAAIDELIVRGVVHQPA